MSITRTDRISCGCGTPVEVFVADSLNAGRHPHLRDALLDRSLHAFRCGVCGQALVVEKDMLYFDFDRKQFFCMYPRHLRAHEEALSDEVKRAYQLWMRERAPRFIAEYGVDFLVRVCFGYEELREKVVIDEANLSDLVVEAVKLDVMLADPWFAQTHAITLRLDGVEADGALRFFPEWVADAPAGPERKRVTVTRALYDDADGRFDDILRVHPGLARGAHVSMLRLIAWPPCPPLGRPQVWR